LQSAQGPRALVLDDSIKAHHGKNMIRFYAPSIGYVYLNKWQKNRSLWIRIGMEMKLNAPSQGLSQNAAKT
jgi:hypothetical protein